MEIYSKFKEVAKRLHSMQEEVLGGTNIDCNEYKLMNILDIEETLNQKCLSDFCSVDKSSMSRLIDKMVTQNLVERTIDENDRRTTYISLSKFGKKSLTKIRDRISKVMENYFNPISDQDKKTFTELLNKILNCTDKRKGDNTKC